MLLTAPVEAVFDAALARYQAGEPGVAALLFASVLEAAPDHADALRLRGLALVRAGAAAKGVTLLLRARRLAPHEPLAHLHLGIGLHAAGRPARAAAVLRRACMMRPDDPAAWLNFAASLVALGQPPAARAAARRAIRLAPRAPEGPYMLGLAEAAAGDAAAARAAFEAAVRLDAGFVDGWIQLGLAFARDGAIGRAAQALNAALAARPGHAAAEATLAGFALLRGEQEEALTQLRAVLEREPGCIAARLNLANALLLDREPAPALALLAGNPPAGRDGAHWRALRAAALLALRRDAAARTELDAIPAPHGDAALMIVGRRMFLAHRAGDAAEAEARAVELAGLAVDPASGLFEHRITARFDLARFHHMGGRRSAAFAEWREGHRLLARVQPFSRPAHAALIDAIIGAYDGPRLRDGPRAANADPAPVFIVGMPRSATSLTEQVLAAHGEVHGAGERFAVHQVMQRLAGGADGPAAVRAAAAVDAPALTEAARDFLAELHALAPEARLVTDKMPGNARHLGLIATLLPGARVIHCRRDPRDIGLSIFQLRFFGYHPYAHDLVDLGWAIGQHERLMAHWRAVQPLPMIEVALSDWVSDFTGTLARVLVFLDLPHDPACERFHEQRRRVRTASADQVRRPINARGLGRWRDYAEQLAPLIAELETAGLIDPATGAWTADVRAA